MFEGLRGAFSGVARSLGEKELGEGDVDAALDGLEVSLLEADVAGEIVDGIRADLRARLAGSRVARRDAEGFVRDSLVSCVSGMLDGAGGVDVLARIAERRAAGEPFLILFVGINGTGKTTTLAKVAHMLRREKLSVVIAASDTFRAGAIEQLRGHAGRLGVKLVAQNYGSDPAAVARDAVLYARSHRTDCVLIDTAGRMQTSRNLMEQVEKIAKVVGPDLKIFVGDSLAGNDTVSQAREFYERVRFDASILTKADADARGGAALSIVKMTSTPVIYVGVGQGYGDLRPFDKAGFLEAVFGPGTVDPGRTAGDPGKAEADPGKVADPGITADPGRADPGKVGDPGKVADPGIAADPGRADPGKVGDPGKVVDPGMADPGAADPFEGISDADIAAYSEARGAGPPGDDAEAAAMARSIREWIRGGRPGAEPKARRKLGLFGR